MDITETTPREPALELRSVRRTFRVRGGPPVTAVQDLSLAVPQGQVLAFLGPNGAGKTTTLDMVLGLTRPTAGSVRVFDGDPRDQVLAGRVSAVLQTGGLLHDLTVRETVRIIASTFERPRPVDEVMERAGITSLARRKVSKCSGGEQQRLRFALALLPDPDLLILDEPTAGMDVATRREFWETMRGDAAAGRTVIFATHYLEEADAFAERIVMVARGAVVADGSTEEVRARASGREMSVDVPAEGAEHWLRRVRALPGLLDLDVRGRRVYLRAQDTDATALRLLSDLDGRNLEVASSNLESAFLALTGEHLDSTEGDDLADAGRHRTGVA